VCEFTEGHTVHTYRDSALLRSAVERQFGIIGEALAQADRADGDVTRRLSDVPRIVAFRNRLIHGYAVVSDEVVWGVLKLHLPRLTAEVGAWLDELEGVSE